MAGSARDLLAEPEEGREEEGPSGEAADFLRQCLATGSTPSKTVQSEAKEAGIPWITVRRAADRLGVLKRKGGMNAGWYWSLPSAEDAHQTAEELEDAHKKNVSNFEHLRADVSKFDGGSTP